jgi:hypothetical protein
VFGAESVAVSESVDDGFRAEVSTVPIMTKDSFEYVFESPSLEYPKALETV